VRSVNVGQLRMWNDKSALSGRVFLVMKIDKPETVEEITDEYTHYLILQDGREITVWGDVAYRSAPLGDGQ